MNSRIKKDLELTLVIKINKIIYRKFIFKKIKKGGM
jgi:hypothetical protein